MPCGVEDIGIRRELRSELRRYGLGLGPILTLFVNANQFESGPRIVARYSARPVECVYCIIPLLLGYVSVREAEKSANLVGVFGQQIVIEISRLVYTARCDILCARSPVAAVRSGSTARAARSALSAAG